MRRCPRCKKDKTLKEYHYDRTRPDGHSLYCKECRKKKNLKKFNNRNFDKNIRDNIKLSIKKNFKNRAWERIVGCNLDELKKHLELNFYDEMSWNNFGKYWTIQKIIPSGYFKYKDVINNELMKSWNWKNLKPMKRTEIPLRIYKIDWKEIEKFKLFDILPISAMQEIHFLTFKEQLNAKIDRGE